MAASIGDTDTFAQASERPGSLGLLIRSIVGLNRAAANQAFAEFLDDKRYTHNQIEFVKLVIDYLTQLNTIDAGRIYESPSPPSHPKDPKPSSPPPTPTTSSTSPNTSATQLSPEQAVCWVGSDLRSRGLVRTPSSALARPEKEEIWQQPGESTVGATLESRVAMGVRVGITVKQAFDAVESQGWAECSVPLSGVVEAIGQEAMIIPTRRGDGGIGALKATDQSEAHPRSLSRHYGRNCFPLHTDGAHLPDPPDAVLLEFRQPTQIAPTLLFVLRIDKVSSLVSHALRQGVFSSGQGRAAFLVHALCEQRLRYDPVVMSPRDALARRTRDYFEECSATAIEYRSPGPGTTLIIDNRRTLHGRAAVPEGVRREADRAMIRWRRK